MRNQFVYSCCINTPASGFDELLESIFCLLLVVDEFSLQKVVKTLEEVGVGWQKVRWIRHMGQLVSTSCMTMWSGIVLEKNWAFSVDQVQALPFLVHLIDLLSILLRHNVFAGIQKAVVVRSAADHQTVTITFSDARLALESVLELLLSLTTKLVATSCHIKSTFCHTSQSNWEMVIVDAQDERWWHFKTTIFFISSQLMRHPLTELFHVSNLLQMPNDHRMVNSEFFGNFLCSRKRISFYDGLSWPLSISHSRPLHSSLGSHFLSKTPWTTSTLYVHHSSWAKCTADVASCLHCFTNHFELK